MTLPDLGWDAEKLSTDKQEQRSLVGEAAFVVNLNGAVIACCIVVLRGLIQRMLLIGWTFKKVRLCWSGSWSEGCGSLYSVRTDAPLRFCVCWEMMYRF